jgi:hypothetical protein
VEDIHFADSARGVMAGERGEVRYTVNEGRTWTIGYPRHPSSLDAPWFRAVHFVDPDHGWMVGDEGIIMKGRFVPPPTGLADPGQGGAMHVHRTIGSIKVPGISERYYGLGGRQIADIRKRGNGIIFQERQSEDGSIRIVPVLLLTP